MRRKKNKWFCDAGNYHEVVLSGTVCLSRNLSDYDFPAKLDDEKAIELIEKLRYYTTEISELEGRSYYSCRVDKLSTIEKDSLTECHTLTPSIKRKKSPTGMIMADDESVSVLINDDDHLCIRASAAGNNIRKAFSVANKIDDFFDSQVNYCYNDKYGYLTSKPQDIGTGMRATFTLSLPGLTACGKIEWLQEEVSKFGGVLQGTYGEGSKSMGFIFQLSNRKTLGLSEQDILENLEQVVAEIIEVEKTARSASVKINEDELVDRMYRSYGVLKYTKLIPQKDAMLLLAQLKLGCDLGVLKLKNGGAGIYSLMIDIQPGNLQKYEGKSMGSIERDKVRARFLNDHLPDFIDERDEK